MCHWPIQKLEWQCLQCRICTSGLFGCGLYSHRCRPILHRFALRQSISCRKNPMMDRTIDAQPRMSGEHPTINERRRGPPVGINLVVLRSTQQRHNQDQAFHPVTMTPAAVRPMVTGTFGEEARRRAMRRADAGGARLLTTLTSACTTWLNAAEPAVTSATYCGPNRLAAVAAMLSTVGIYLTATDTAV